MSNTNCYEFCASKLPGWMTCSKPVCPCHDKLGWEERFEERFSAATFTWKDLFFANQAKSEVKSFIANLLSEAEKRGFEIGMIRDAKRDKELKEEGFREGAQDERQFILNILDGIDMADEQMGNKGGGTKAVRHALKSRLLKGKEKL